MTHEQQYQGIVDRIVSKGPHGPYAMAKVESLALRVTFSLKKEVWQERIWPERGTVVVLSEVIRKRAGWRAQHVRFFRPDDEARSKENNT